MKSTYQEVTRFPLPLTELIHENLSLILSFVYSREPLRRMVAEKFAGEWKYLNKTIFEISEEKANKACLEFALFLRVFDDDEKLSEYDSQTQVINCGRLILNDKPEKDLPFREVANKIIHCSRFEWHMDVGAEPLLICYSRENEKWLRAEIDIVAVSAVCGRLMH